MAFFLIGRGPEDDLRLLSESFFESRQEAMAELSRISADPEFSQWDTDVFVLDLEQGVPVLLVRPQSAELPMSAIGEHEPDTEAEGAAESSAPDVSEAPEAFEPAEPIGAEEPELAEEYVGEASAVADEHEAAEQGDLRDALLRTTEHMSAEGIVPPPSAGLSDVGEAPEVPEEMVTPPEEEPEMTPEEASEAEAEPGAENAWPWAAAPPPPESVTDAVSPDIANVYEALEAEASADLEPEAAAEGMPASADVDAESAADDSDFILDLDAIQPVALDENPAQEGGSEEPTATDQAEESALPEASGEDSYSSTLTDYTCEDCVYVETCPNRDQRAPKDCGSFQWK